VKLYNFERLKDLNDTLQQIKIYLSFRKIIGLVKPQFFCTVEKSQKFKLYVFMEKYETSLEEMIQTRTEQQAFFGTEDIK